MNSISQCLSGHKCLDVILPTTTEFCLKLNLYYLILAPPPGVYGIFFIVLILMYVFFFAVGAMGCRQNGCRKNGLSELRPDPNSKSSLLNARWRLMWASSFQFLLYCFFNITKHKRINPKIPGTQAEGFERTPTPTSITFNPWSISVEILVELWLKKSAIGPRLQNRVASGVYRPPSDLEKSWLHAWIRSTRDMIPALSTYVTKCQYLYHTLV